MDKAFKDEFFLASIQLADLAAEISQKFFRTPFKIDHKPDYSPVTTADQQIEQTLRDWIKQNYPEHGVIGEEYSQDNTLAKYTWVLDPIDGTVAFASGKPTFSTLIALLEDGKPVIGVIDQPIVNERFIAVEGNGAWGNGKKLVTSSQRVLSGARLNATTPYMFKSEIERDKFERLRKKVCITGWGGDAYAYGLLADGHIDIIMEADLQYYDVAAVRPIIEESGGVITDWQGRAINHRDFSGQCIASANPRLHEQALKIIN